MNSRHLSMSYVIVFCVVACILLVPLSTAGKDCALCYRTECKCTKTSVECHNAEFSSPNILLQFRRCKPNVKVIRMTGNNFVKLNTNLFGNCSSAKTFPGLLNLIELDLSRNNIRVIHGKSFHCIPHLKTLILDHNNWRPDGDHLRVFTDLVQLTKLSLKNAFLESMNGQHHLLHLSRMLNISDPEDEPGLSRLEHLNLASNEFVDVKNVTGEALCRFTRLKVLDLSNNDLNSAYIQSCTKQLEVLDLSHNRFIYMSAHLMTVLEELPNLNHVYIGFNDYACDCHAMQFHTWLNTTAVNVTDRKWVRCRLGYFSTYQGMRLDRMSPSLLVCNDHHRRPIETTVFFTVFFASITVVIISLSVYNRKKIKTAYVRLRSRYPWKNYLHFRENSDYSSVSAVASF